MQKKKKRVPEFRPEYSGIYRVVLALYPTRIWSCTIRVLPVSVPNIKISVSVKKRVFALSVSGTQRVYPTRFHPYHRPLMRGSSPRLGLAVA
jgi:hypothetical protein